MVRDLIIPENWIISSLNGALRPYPWARSKICDSDSLRECGFRSCSSLPQGQAGHEPWLPILNYPSHNLVSKGAQQTHHGLGSGLGTPAL